MSVMKSTSTKHRAHEKTWMIYGATGYTGRLIAEEACRRGYQPILAGRSEKAVTQLASKLGLPARTFSVESSESIAAHLDGITAVLHCAGPFSATSRPMLDACLRTGAHYLDITGEIAVFEAIHQRNAEIARAGISAIPGVGFDVVGSDCLAALLKRKLPDAVRLRMGMQWVGGRMSKGTIKSMVEGIAKGGCIRRDGRLIQVPAEHKIARLPFQADRQRQLAVSIPWGDVSTAFYSTGIGNIEFYFAKSAVEIAMLRAVNPFQHVIARPAVQTLLKQAVDWIAEGPTDNIRSAARSFLWGEAENRAGKKVALRMRLPEGYTFTYLAALASMERVLAGGIPPGAMTPSMAFGADFTAGLPDVSIEQIAPAVTV